MAKLKNIKPTPPLISVYERLKGIDLSRHSSEVSPQRARDLLNMISDEGGMPRKRPGYEPIALFSDTKRKIVSLNYLREKNYDFILICSFDTFHEIYRLSLFKKKVNEDFNEGTVKDIGSLYVDEPLCFAYSTSKETGFYVLGLPFDLGFNTIISIYQIGDPSDEANTIIDKPDPAYIPTILISRSPTGGGIPFENFNLLTKVVKESFLNADGSKTFLLSMPAEQINTVYYLEGGVWKEATIAGHTETTVTIEETVANAEGRDNVRVEYTLKEYINRDFSKCNIKKYYDGRFFFSGHPIEMQKLWFSKTNDPTYVKESDYVFLGGSNQPIVGMISSGSCLAVLKKGNSSQDNIFYLQSDEIKINQNIGGELTEIRVPTYSIKYSAQGLGGLGRKTFSGVVDEPLFLSTDGICGIVNEFREESKIVRNRSRFVDARLKNEKNLDEAIGVTWKNYYLLFINNNAYILDGRQKTREVENNSDYLYEAYYWNNIPATAVCVIGDELIFGTVDGGLYKFKNKKNLFDYSDKIRKVNPDGTTVIEKRPIKAFWKTPYDDFKLSWRLKTLQKKGTVITFLPTGKLDIEAYYSKDYDDEILIGEFHSKSLQSLENISLENFSFLSLEKPKDSALNKKVKKFKRLSLIFKNEKLNQDFGLLRLVISYKSIKDIKK